MLDSHKNSTIQLRSWQHITLYLLACWYPWIYMILREPHVFMRQLDVAIHRTCFKEPYFGRYPSEKCWTLGMLCCSSCFGQRITCEIVGEETSCHSESGELSATRVCLAKSGQILPTQTAERYGSSRGEKQVAVGVGRINLSQRSEVDQEQTHKSTNGGREQRRDKNTCLTVYSNKS